MRECAKAMKMPEHCTCSLIRWSGSLNRNPEDIPADLGEARLDRGERDTLALAERWQSPLVLMDETVGRRTARDRGLRVRGSLGILVEAFEKGLIQADQLLLYFEEMIRRQDIWINPGLAERLLREVLG